MFLTNVRLDSKTLNKLINGEKVIVKSSNNGQEVSIVLNDKKVYNKLQKALANMKGSSINGDIDVAEILMADTVEGQGIMRKLKKGFNKIGRDTEKAFNVVKNDLDKNAGSYVETAKKIIPKNAVKQLSNAAIIAGTTYIGQPQLAPGLMHASNLGVNTLYAKDFKKPLNSGWQKAVTTGAIQTANEGINSAVKNGFNTSAPQIQEAVPIKEGMGFRGKALRNVKTTQGENIKFNKKMALQNVPSGGSFMPVGKGFKPVGKGKGFKAINGTGFMPIG